MMRIFVIAWFCGRLWAERCEDLAKTSLVNASVDEARVVRAGTFAKMEGLPAFCRVAVTARPSKDSDIKIELWLPEKDWNERLEGTGNGGFAGHISYAPLASGLRHGYAVVNTDMGMATPADTNQRIFAGRPERWKDWGYRATHEMTIAAKVLTAAFYGQQAKRSYFYGCSTGGEQALSEAEQFPEDYDGIVGGAPAHNRTGVHMSILWNFAVMEKDAASHVPAAKLPALSKAVVTACAGADGVIADPTQCGFDPAVLRCAGADGDACLTAAQVDTVRKLYQGPRNPGTGEQIYPGLPKGSEFAWDKLATERQPPFAPIFQWVFGTGWDWRSFDFDRSTREFEAKLGWTLNATSTDLVRFRARGGKLLLYHGWADWLVPPGETIRYYDAAVKRNGGDAVRLFMLPGVSHCGGGPGADTIDPLGAVVRWVEEDAIPEKLEAVKVVKGAVTMRRVVCAYPKLSCEPVNSR